MRYLFEDYALDIERHELRNGDAVLAIEPQVFDVLAYLIRHRERVVSKEDLLANVWEGRSISDSTFTSRINSARGAIGDSGEDQRLIRTVPRRGYRFVGAVREQQAADDVTALLASPINEAAPAALPERNGVGRELVESPVYERALTANRRHATGPRTILMVSVGAAAGALAAALLFTLWLGTNASRIKAPPPQRFDATIVPLVGDAQRRTLEGYPGRPDAKALAIAREGWSVADGASDTETAKQEALRQCAARAKAVCRIYAVGMDVVWSKDTLPLAAPRDLHSEPLDVPLVADDIPTLNSASRREVAETHGNAANHKALALAARFASSWVSDRETRTEAARMAVERCTEVNQHPCLLLAVDGFLTVQILKSRPVARTFLPSTEAEISGSDRERIAQVYQGAEWRALARGRKGSWHPVAGAPSEAAAIEGALKSCAQVDDACRLYAIGNFRVADE